jgi:glyoxylase-like metal-dependent hydrolase (beta-lactamase superfamily II)
VIEENIHFYTLNVSQGDSHVIHFPKNNAAIVIDPGDSDLINQLLHEQLKIKSIPFILVSHGDWDHMEGINRVIKGSLHEKRGRSIRLDYIFLNSEGMAKSSENTKFGKLFIRSDLVKF